MECPGEGGGGTRARSRGISGALVSGGQAQTHACHPHDRPNHARARRAGRVCCSTGAVVHGQCVAAHARAGRRVAVRKRPAMSGDWHANPMVAPKVAPAHAPAAAPAPPHPIARGTSAANCTELWGRRATSSDEPVRWCGGEACSAHVACTGGRCTSAAGCVELWGRRAASSDELRWRCGGEACSAHGTARGIRGRRAWSRPAAGIHGRRCPTVAAVAAVFREEPHTTALKVETRNGGRAQTGLIGRNV